MSNAAPAGTPATKPSAARPRQTAKPQVLPALLAEVEKKYAQAKTLSADFTQVNTSAAMKQEKKSSGKLQFKRPNMLRWETRSPDTNTLISDGKTFWYYTPPFDEGEPGQVVIRKSSQVQSRLAHALLAGSFSAARDMKITPEGATRFVLRPKKGSAGTVTRATIEIDTSKKLITEVILEHQGGNRSDIRLSNIELGGKLSDDLFHFTPPPNTEEVKE